MAMRTASPWWASLAFGIGLLLFAVGERLLSSAPDARIAFTGLGLLLIVAVTAARLYAMVGSSGARRRVEGVMVKSHIAVLVGLVVYLFSTDWGVAKLGITDSTTTIHIQGALTVLYLAIFAAGVVPLAMMELSLGTALRSWFDIRNTKSDDAGVELMRVRELGWSGLSVGLALSFLMVTCQVGNERNVQKDVSYFKTATPGESTKNIVSSSSEPMKALLFFPDANEVKNQVKDYFDALSGSTHHIAVEMHDRFSDAELAGKYKVVKDGTVILVRGTGDKEKSQTIDIDTDIVRARGTSGKLRNFDHEVNSALLKLMRDKRKAYLVTGHGELNDPDTIPVEVKAHTGQRLTSIFKKRVNDFNYEVKDLSLLTLAQDVPDDATVVILLAPSIALQPAEWASLERYIDRGGRMMLVLDPTAPAGGLGPFEAKFGLRFLPGHLTDEQQFLPMRRTLSDRRAVLTNDFSAHPSTTTLSKASNERGIPLLDSGALEDLPLTGKNGPKKTITIRSLDTSFLDLNDNYTFDAGVEKKQHWNIAAAVEGPRMGEKGDKDGYRALVFADANLWVDVVGRDMLGRTATAMWADAFANGLLEDSIHWLGGEEVFSGDIVTEDDKPIQHTKNEDQVWFILMTAGVPLIVLTLGLVGTSAKRRRGSRKTEVTQ